MHGVFFSFDEHVLKKTLALKFLCNQATMTLYRNRLKYALNMKEVQTIVKQRLIKIDGKVRTDARFPTGFMDVIQVEKTGENFRIIYDVKGRFTVHRITAQEAKYKLCKVTEVSFCFLINLTTFLCF